MGNLKQLHFPRSPWIHPHATYHPPHGAVIGRATAMHMEPPPPQRTPPRHQSVHHFWRRKARHLTLSIRWPRVVFERRAGTIRRPRAGPLSISTATASRSFVLQISAQPNEMKFRSGEHGNEFEMQPALRLDDPHLRISKYSNSKSRNAVVLKAI